MDARLTKEIVEKLRTSPVRIQAAALFGSYAKGSQQLDSDIDLLLISDPLNVTKHKRGKMIAAIKEWLALAFPCDITLLTTRECLSNFTNHNPMFLDIAWEGIILLDDDGLLTSTMHETKRYILENGIRKLEDGWQFTVPDRGAIFLSKVSNKDFAVAMLTDGKRDFEIGLRILKDGYFDKAIYHFQQAAEKAVKSVLICFGIFRKTHFVGEILLREIGARNLEEGWKEKLEHVARISTEMEPDVTWSRYPGIDEDVLWVPYDAYTEDDAREACGKCEVALREAGEFLEWWFTRTAD